MRYPQPLFHPDDVIVYFCIVKKQKPRLAVLASRYPYPIEKGDKLRLYHQLKYLSEYYDIFLFTLSDSTPHQVAYQEIDQYCQEIFIYQDKKFRRNFRVIGHLHDRWPAQVRYFYSPAIHRRFLSDFFKINADIIYCQLYRMAPYLSGIDAPKVLDIMDNFGAIAALHAQHARKWHERWFWQREQRLIQSFETQVLPQFQHATVISERDAKHLPSSPGTPISIIRNGIDVSYFQSYTPTADLPQYDMGFFGNLEYTPNREGIRYLIQKIIPVFRQHRREVKILIGGKGAETLPWSEDDYPEITIHGWYDDIRSAYYAVRFFIVPLFLGSGMQNKVLEAMACNRPVICTSHVIQGMPMLRDYALIADKPHEFYNHYVALTEDKAAQQKQSGMLTVLNNVLTWEGQCSILNKVLDDTRKNYRWNFTRYH